MFQEDGEIFTKQKKSRTTDFFLPTIAKTASLDRRNGDENGSEKTAVLIYPKKNWEIGGCPKKPDLLSHNCSSLPKSPRFRWEKKHSPGKKKPPIYLC